jgi:hypothetical protein
MGGNVLIVSIYPEIEIVIGEFLMKICYVVKQWGWIFWSNLSSSTIRALKWINTNIANGWTGC